MKTYIILIILFINFSSCSEDNPTSSNSENLIEVQFDLQTGFSDVALSIMEDNKYYFSGIFTGIELLAGPQASFITFLPQGEHDLVVIRTQLDNITNFKMDTCVVEIGESDKYWIGMGVNSNSDLLYFAVQDSGFFYL
jgi:hypothetical protein